MEHICAEIEVIYSSQTCPEVLFVEFFVAGCCWVSACCDSVSSCCVTLLWAFGSIVIQLLGSRKAPYPASPPEETGLASLLIKMGTQWSLLINKTSHEFLRCLFSTWSNFVLYKLSFTVHNYISHSSLFCSGVRFLAILCAAWRCRWGWSNGSMSWQAHFDAFTDLPKDIIKLFPRSKRDEILK